MKKITLLFIMSCFLLIYCIANALEKHDVVTYTETSDNFINIIWDPVENADIYEIRLLSFERNIYENIRVIFSNYVSLKLLKSGLYSFEVRACSVIRGDCSDWSSSLNSSLSIVDGEAKPWWIYVYINPPGSITIN